MAADLLPVDEAIRRITAAMEQTGEETLDLNKTPMADLLGRILTKPVTSLLNHPPHDVSAMDGYAVRAEDVQTLPATLTNIGESAAGHPFAGSIGKGQAVRIFTGAHCPEHTSVIILQEDTALKGDQVTISDAPEAGRFIRIKGNDFAENTLISDANTALTARRIALIASAGHGTVTVRKKPVVAVISTGDELVAPGVMPTDEQIISSNGVFLSALLTAMGAEVMPIGIVPDNDAALSAALAKASDADLIVTSGGASVGSHDGIARHMTQTKGALDFWRIAMRPGKPLIFGNINGTALLGLPGNPVSTGVCAMVFVAAAIRAMMGQDPQLPYQKAVVDVPLAANDKRQDFLRATQYIDQHGQLHVTPFSHQDSGMLNLFSKADALLVRPAHAPALGQGAVVDILPIPALY